MVVGACIYVLLASLVHWAHATPVILGGITEQNATVFDDSEIGTVVSGIYILDFDDHTYTIPEDDISLGDPSNQFETRIQGNLVSVIVATADLVVGDHVVTVTLLSQTLTVTVNINVRQTNFAPVFLISHYFATISETYQVGDPIISNILAIDFDTGSNGEFEYQFQNPSLVSPPLAISPSTGVITLIQSLDYDEGPQMFEFIIVARETESQSLLSATASVLISVTNINDNAPFFPDGVIAYEYSIAENEDPSLYSTSNSVTSIITASDGDAGAFGEITYELTGGRDLFAIDQTAAGAQLKTLQSLNREDSAIYVMTLIARDGGDPPLADSVQIEVEVQDVNDIAPVFSINEYQFELFEGTVYTNFVTFHATDGDAEAPNNQITYTAITRTDDPTGNQPFQLNPSSGAVSVDRLNYESDVSYTLAITASDGGMTPLTAQATLHIIVMPVNELSPVFQQAKYTTAVAESLAITEQIGVTVQASDPEGHEVQYSIDAEFSDGYFFNISENGVITLAQSLDRDPPFGHDMFTFMVLATDVPSPGQLPRTGGTQVVVTVMDINDNAPVITEPEQSHVTLEVAEGPDVDLATVLFRIIATDIDGDSDGDTITYLLSATDDSLSFFSVDEESGVFRQTAQVDRETCTPVPCHYQMTATACDAGESPMCSDLSVSVAVSDINDNPPVLTNNPLTATEQVLECEVDGRMLSTVTATDDVDTGDFAEVVFKAETDAGNHIILNERTGQLYLSVGVIDYDNGDRMFSMTVRAIDNPDGPENDRLTSTDTFTQTIVIGDCNDEPPVFTATHYEFSVSENVPSGVITGDTIDTTDADVTEDNKMVTYSFTNQRLVDWFDITDDGAVVVRNGAVVDREHANLLTDNQGNGVVTLTVQAENMATTATLISPQNAQIVISISDENDNAPVMDAVPLTGSESITLLESAPRGSILAVVRATDLDVGINAIIQYELTSGNVLGKFSLDADSGVLTLEEEIDIEADPHSYTVTITAVNPAPATPPPDSDQDDIVLVITVRGTNEHAPSFMQDRYERNISEYNILSNDPQPMAGDIVVTVFATDADNDPNNANHNDIEYSIAGGNEDDIFQITNPMVGNIELKNPHLLDFETTTSYSLLITATDLVIPESDRKTDTTYVYISVRDENDNAPVFSSETYVGLVNEGQDPGTPVILISPITAMDVDSLEGAESLEYEITTVGDPQPSPFLAFTLNEDGSGLRTTVPIDREMSGDTFTFQLMVTDTGGHHDTAMVTVNIADINDNPPVIQETPGGLYITIPENHPVDSTLRQITAVDNDLDTNAQFRFIMQGGAGYFEINVNTGVVKLVASLQALEPPMMFPLTVYAIDTGGLNSSVTFLVNLTYSNDHPPIFESSEYFGSITECVEDGTDITPVITLRARDADSNAMVSYFIDSSPVGELFRLDTRGGVADILTQGSGRYDRETTNILRFTVFATDGVVGSDDDSATVTITVTDCNDNHPIFTQEMYEVDVYEGTVSGTTVVQVHTNDADLGENREVRFSVDSVLPPSLTDVFVVDPETGGIVTNLDITNQYTGTSTCSSLTVQSNNITLTVKATDQATLQPQLSNYTTVFIRLLDRNSDAPSFNQTRYSFSISENVENVVIGTVLATDECDQNSRVTYVLDGGEDSDPFEINPDTGVVRLVSSLNREANDLLVVQLQAVDDGTDPGPQTGHASISVTVLDENDNDPMLTRDSFEMTLPENVPIGTTLITLLASDIDLGENATLSYRILSGDTDLFQLEDPPGSGSDHLVTTLPLDRETISNHVVTVIVEDGGYPARNDTAIMNLTLSDINDNEPIWTAGHGTEFNIDENAGSIEIVDLDAMDIDQGLNSQLVYFFIDGSQDSGPFHIDRDNGTLSLVGQLDYETTPEYQLGIVVADRGGEEEDDEETSLRNTTTVTITVLDINDNLPYFNRCPHTYEIPETLDVGSIVAGEMMSTVDDKDSTVDSYYFYLVDEDNVKCNEAFCIDEATGEIRLNDEIDYEVKSMYIFYVVVSDRPNLTPEEAYSSPTIDLCDTVATQDNNITKVEVSLVDINDHAPVFDPDTLLAVVAEEAEFDTTITVLKATDLDVNETYSKVYYKIIAVDPPYLVNRETGEVTTADVFTGRSGDIDSYPVQAYNTDDGMEPRHTTNAVLTVRVFKECQQINAVVDTTREDAETCRPQLEDAIANLTKHVIYTTKVRVRQNAEQGIVDTTRADVIFYALDRDTEEVVEPQEVINVIEQALDLQQEPLRTAFEECRVLEVKTFCTEGDSSASTASISAVIGSVLGILSAIIIALLICLLCVCALERRKARKLRMRKKPSFEQSSNFSQFSQMGTSNPIWMPPYEQWEEESTTTAAQSTTVVDRENPIYESQELTIEMFQDDKDDALSAASSGANLIKPPRLSSTPGAHDSVYDDYDPLADALGISDKPEDSETSLI